MSKYRICYKSCNKYKSIDLTNLNELKDKNITDIKTIDDFTMSYNSLEELLLYLKANRLITNNIFELYITVDKKEKGITTLKKIFTGKKILFKDSKEKLNISYIHNWIKENFYNGAYMEQIAINYIEKYKNAYDRITFSSFLLDLFGELKTLSTRIKSKGFDMLTNDEKKIYKELVEQFLIIEFYKYDKDYYKKHKKMKIKLDKDGKKQENYRNIHDFIILLDTLDEKVLYSKISPNREIKKENKNEFNEDDRDEFIELNDYYKTNKEIVDNINSNYICIDGKDILITKEELLDTLNSDVNRLIKKYN